MGPRELAERLASALERPLWVGRVEVAGPGFLNFYVTRAQYIESILTAALEEPFSRTTGHKVLVEYTQPNPFKPFHIGHLMSNTLGESLTRLFEHAGHEVRRANYQGDVGLHVAKALYGIHARGSDPSDIHALGEAYVYGNEQYETDDAAKRAIVELNKRVYARDDALMDAYRAGREASLAHFEELYAVLGTKFDYYFFESETEGPGRMLVKEGLSQGVFEESDGAVVYRGEDEGLHTRVFLTREGLPTYEAKELGLAQLKAEKWDFDENVTTVAVEQDEYFKVVRAALTRLRPLLGPRYGHVPHGMMQLTSGKMSSRKGNVITGESLLADMRALALTKVAERSIPEEEKSAIADMVAVAAIKYSVLKQKTGKNIVFDPERSLSFEGDSGPYLQYAHTRAASVLARAAEEGTAPGRGLPPAHTTELERLLVRFDEVVLRAATEREPHYVTTYLTALASAWNSWYAAEKILDGTPAAPYKLAIAAAFQRTMSRGLWCLGIPIPERM